MSKIGDTIKARLLHSLGHLLLKKNTSEFWTGPVNLIAQLILRKFGPMLGDQAAVLSQQAADLLLTLLPYAAGRFISKLTKGS